MVAPDVHVALTGEHVLLDTLPTLTPGLVLCLRCGLILHGEEAATNACRPEQVRSSGWRLTFRAAHDELR